MKVEPVVGAQVRALRVDRGMTQQQLADAAGMQRSSLCTIESGAPVREETAIRLAEALGCELRIVPRADNSCPTDAPKKVARKKRGA